MVFLMAVLGFRAMVTASLGYWAYPTLATGKDVFLFDFPVTDL
jgi:hypothetical protein